MKIYRRLQHVLQTLIRWFWTLFITIHEYKNIYKKRELIRKTQLTAEEKKQVDEYYKQHYGKKIPYWWHRLYKSYTGRFDYRYFPEMLFSTKIEPKCNPRSKLLLFEDKNMLQTFFGDIVKTPRTIVSCVNGIVFDNEKKVLSPDELKRTLQNYAGGNYSAVAKVTLDTSSGRDVHFLTVCKGELFCEGQEYELYIKELGKNFVIQEKVCQCKQFETLYPNSLNTLRVITYITERGVQVAPISMRLGQGGGKVDNSHAGGIAIAVKEDGKLSGEAFSESGKRYTVHPDTQVEFENYQLPSIDAVKEKAIQMHWQIPQVRFISWDITIDENGDIVVI